MITGRAIATEGAVLGVFIIGLVVAGRYRRTWKLTEIIAMYAIGLLFEVLTAGMWQYHNIFLVFSHEVSGDISVLFPLGWAGMIMTATALAERLWQLWRVSAWWRRHLVLMCVWWVVGGVAETTFYNIGMIEYVHNADTDVNFLLGQAPGLPPTMILLFYGIAQPLSSQYFRWLERQLARRRR